MSSPLEKGSWEKRVVFLPPEDAAIDACQVAPEQPTHAISATQSGAVSLLVTAILAVFPDLCARLRDILKPLIT